MNTIKTLLLCITVLFLASCSRNKPCVVLGNVIEEDEENKGTIDEDYKIVLDGDTFLIRNRIGARLLLAQKETDGENDSCYLIKMMGDSLYRVQAKEEGILSIDSTERFVIFENGEVFDTESEKVLFRTAGGLSDYLTYLGSCGDKFMFGNWDVLYFSDGKHIELQPNAQYQLSDGGHMIHLTLGAQCMDMSPKELYQRISKPVETDRAIKHIEKGYFIRPRYDVCEGIGNGIGFDVDMDVPTGNDTADIAIRQWMATQIRDNVFDLLEYNPERIGISKCDSVEDMLRCLDSLGDIWKKTLRNKHVDTQYDKIDSRIAIKRIVDCEGYVTYYFSCVPYTGGAHAAPSSYYATYDKRRNVFLTASNTIKKGARGKFVKAALRDKKKQRDDENGEESEWTEFIKVTSEIRYCCDKADTEWQNKKTPYTINDFPLPHLAIIPEGVVVTYHPYQIDCFAAGEYHGVVPLKDIAGCLKYKYEQAPNNRRLDIFIRNMCED